MSIFVVAFIIGFILPFSVLLLTRRSCRIFHIQTIIFISILLIQIASEALLASIDLTHLIKYSSALFVSFRLIQLGYIYQLASKLTDLSQHLRSLVLLTFWLNVILWFVVLVRLNIKIDG